MPKHFDKTKHLEEPKSEESDVVTEEEDETYEKPPPAPEVPLYRIALDPTGGIASTSQATPEMLSHMNMIQGIINKKLSQFQTPGEIRDFLKTLSAEPQEGGGFRMKMPFLPENEPAPDISAASSSNPILPGNPNDVYVRIKKNGEPELLTLREIFDRSVLMAEKERAEYLKYFNFGTLRDEVTGEIKGLSVLGSPKHRRKKSSKKPPKPGPFKPASGLLPNTATMIVPPQSLLTPVTPFDLTGLQPEPPPGALTSAYYSAQNYAVDTISGGSFVITFGLFVVFLVFFYNLMFDHAGDGDRNTEGRRREERRTQQNATERVREQEIRVQQSKAQQRAERRRSTRGKKRRK